MENKTFMNADDIAEEMGISKSSAYKILRRLNAELREQGYYTVAGRVNTNYFRKKCVTASRQEGGMQWLYTKIKPRGCGEWYSDM